MKIRTPRTDRLFGASKIGSVYEFCQTLERESVRKGVALERVADALESLPVNPDTNYWQFRQLHVKRARRAAK